MNSFYLEFRGYWRDQKREMLPNLPGIYCVYRSGVSCVDEVNYPLQLLYMGESETPRDEILSHEFRTQWESCLKGDEELMYTYAPIQKFRRQVYAAMIFQHRPVLNEEFNYLYPFPRTAVAVSGRTRFLKVSFIVPDELQARSRVLLFQHPGLRTRLFASKKLRSV